MSGQREDLTAAYLADLECEAARLPWNLRTELVEDVRSHIEVALAEMRERREGGGGVDASSGGSDEATQVRAMLEALGEPREIVAAALADTPFAESASAAGPPYPLGGQEIFAIVLLLFGGFLFVIGWIAGVLLLWNAPRWTVREKVVGTCVVPGGYLAFWLLLTEPGGGLPVWLGAALSVLFLVGPAAVAVLLFRNARKRPAGHVHGGASVGRIVLGVAAGVGALMIAGAALFLGAGTSSSPGQPRHGEVGPVSYSALPSSSGDVRQVGPPAPSSSGADSPSGSPSSSG